MKVNCNYCNKEIERKPSEVKRQKNQYCSKECTDNARKIRAVVACDTCGKEVEKRPSQIKEGSGSYCSKSCAATTNNKYKVRNWTDGSGSYRERALREYGKVCNRCNYSVLTPILQVHHVDHNRGNNDISNLEVLCPNCHCEEHYC